MPALFKANTPSIFTMVPLLNPNRCLYREFISEKLDVVLEPLVNVVHYF
jgi:hypothetical protein